VDACDIKVGTLLETQVSWAVLDVRRDRLSDG
jgi:hypothetical protein